MSITKGSNIGVWAIPSLLCVTLTVFANVTIDNVQQGNTQADYTRQDKGCLACHSSELQIHRIVEDINKCNQCHSSNANVNFTQTVLRQSNAQKTVSQAVSKTVSKRIIQTNQTISQSSASNLFPQNKNFKSQKEVQAASLGMRYPMQYSPSRLGDAPNEMVSIPAGKFVMGSNSRLPDEGPQHKVTLADYYIDKYEVTNLQYKKFIDATRRRSPKYFRNRTFPQGRADHPVTYVGWDDANTYCQWAGKRLPTEQEWEKASRGTDARTYPWGNDFKLSHANTPGRWKEFAVFGDTTPVGAFARGVSPYGVHDMSGNVWEWTASWYKPYPKNKTPSESYGERYKVLKGGSWWDCSFYKCGLSAPVYNRSFFAKKVKNDTFGFRCAKDEKNEKNAKI